MANYRIRVFKSVILVRGETYDPLKSLLRSGFLNLGIESNFSILYIYGVYNCVVFHTQKVVC